MSVTIIVGSQWGDEGKGKIVDFLAKNVAAVVRYQGGGNAGHTVIVGSRKTVFHLIPSGILQKKICVLGNGMVINPEGLLKEVEEIEKLDIDVKKYLFISDRAHVIFPKHQQLDIHENVNRIGSTGQGIGPAYTDKFARVGVRMIDLLGKKSNSPIINKFIKKFKNNIIDTSVLLNQLLDQKKEIILEGAQGTLLDIDHGTYPFVTSSNSTSGGALTGSGIGPLKVKHIFGIAKAYTTRVGQGPFPTELLDKTGKFLRKNGQEFGATTGRPRRCGWLDLVILRFAVRINSLNGWIVTKLDVLSGLPKIKVCVAYKYQGKKLTDFPANLRILEKCQPIYQEFSGWKDLGKVTTFAKLPQTAQKYLRFLEKETQTPIKYLSFGRDRHQIIRL